MHIFGYQHIILLIKMFHNTHQINKNRSNKSLRIHTHFLSVSAMTRRDTTRQEDEKSTEGQTIQIGRNSFSSFTPCLPHTGMSPDIERGSEIIERFLCRLWMISKHPSLPIMCPFSFSDRELLWLTAATIFGFHSSQRTAAAPTHIQMLRWSVASSDFLHAVVLAPCETQFLMFHVFSGSGRCWTSWDTGCCPLSWSSSSLGSRSFSSH